MPYSTSRRMWSAQMSRSVFYAVLKSSRGGIIDNASYRSIPCMKNVRRIGRRRERGSIIVCGPICGQAEAWVRIVSSGECTGTYDAVSPA